MFGEYLNKAMRLIKNLTIGTPSETWINQVKCGRDSFQKLREHYDGKSEGERRKHGQGRLSINCTVAMKVPKLFRSRSMKLKLNSMCWKGSMFHFTMRII